MRNQQPIRLVVFHPRQKGSGACSNRFLERCIDEVIKGCTLPDLTMRFFGTPNISMISGRITGRLPDPYEQPRDMVIVAFEARRPVGYLDLSSVSEPGSEAEISLLVRSDRQRHGIGKSLFLQAVQAMYQQGTFHVEAYVHLENAKMKKALQKWSQEEIMQGIHLQRVYEEGEWIYSFDLRGAMLARSFMRPR